MLRVSIIVCTCDRPESLRVTLDSLTRCQAPENTAVELIVVDNGMHHDVRAIVEQLHLSRIRVKHVRLPPPAGLSRARNRGLAEAEGDVLLFTDDDVLPPPDWIQRMCRPIIEGRADAVAGGVCIAPHLLRPWMTPTHRSWLASTEYLDPESPQEMVGANMAFARHVLSRVPSFDTELGPGALGQSDDSLFAWQLLRAGYRIAPALDAAVQHHFDPARLRRESFVAMARRRGASAAYLMHHWEHRDVRWPRLRILRDTMRLWIARLLRRREFRQPEGMPEWEMSLLTRIDTYRHILREKKRPRAYPKHGLIKLGARSCGSAGQQAEAGHAAEVCPDGRVP